MIRKPAVSTNMISDYLIIIERTNVPDEGYSRNAPCALNLISTFLLHVYNTSVKQIYLLTYLLILFIPDET